MRRYWAAAAAFGALAACGLQPGAGPANVNLSGFPPAFKEGYSDGCGSARGNYVRNYERFKSDAQYGQGWRDGRDLCGGRSKSR